jgi:translation initiation factor 2B subunit (eIF-2B alpha/beta/delta family)
MIKREDISKEELRDLLWLANKRIETLVELNDKQAKYSEELVSKLHAEIEELKKAQRPKESRETLENRLGTLRVEFETLIATETRLKEERRDLERQRVREPDADVRSTIQRKWNTIGPLLEENAKRQRAVKSNITKTKNKLEKHGGSN